MTEIKVFAYYRVSTDKQKKKLTEKTQKFVCENWMKELNIKIHEEFIEAESGGNDDRPKFNSILNRIEEVDGIVVYDNDRLVRSFEMGMRMMFLLRDKKKNIYIASRKEVKDFQLDTDQLIAMIGYWADERERKKIVERLKSSIQRRISEGKGWGRKRIDINWDDYMKLLSVLNNKSAIARAFNISHITLYRRIIEHKEELMIKEELTEQDKLFLEVHKTVGVNI